MKPTSTAPGRSQRPWICPRRRPRSARSHLSDPGDRSFTMHRYVPEPPCRHWVRVFWIPVWHVPAGEIREQRVLSHPACVLSVTGSYARLLGPSTRAARTPLSGSGWAFGALLMPGAGRALLQEDTGRLLDTHLDAERIPQLADLIPKIRAIMAAAPSSSVSHRRARALLEHRLSCLGTPAPDAALLNSVVARVEDDSSITSVRSLCAAVQMQERTLQRLCMRFLGVSPRWIIRQRRLQDAAVQLRTGGTLSDLAAALGYADQAHFCRDFRAATGWTPRQFASMTRAHTARRP